MAKAILPTNFQDDILDSSMDGKRRYKQTTNADGTVSLEDASTYDQVGSNFGASQLNEISKAVNQSADSSKIISDPDTASATTEQGYIADVQLFNHLNDSLGGLEFNVSDSKPQWREVGADTWNFFSSDAKLYYHYQSNNGTTTYNTTFELDKNKKYIFIFIPAYQYVTNGTNIIGISDGGIYERFMENGYVADTRAYMVSNATFITASTHIDVTNAGVCTYYIEY